MKPTTIADKLFPSIINIILTFLITLPFLFIFGNGVEWKLSWIGIFFLYNAFFEFLYNRCPGMMLFGTRYDHTRTVLQKILYILLYTLSFSTILFHIWFPFDLLLVNLLFIQIPFIYLTGTTLHGFVSGRTRTII